MGNLLGSPVTEKETFSDKTSAGIEYGISSMQGWRIHMEDAHIDLGELYAEECDEDDEQLDETNDATKEVNPNAKASRVVNRIPIENTSLFAVFDGHGGEFAAKFAAENLVNVLSRNTKLIQYAKEIRNCDEDVEKQKSLVELLEDALQESFLDLDMEFLRVAVDGNNDNQDGERDNQYSDSGETMDESGTTALVVIMTPKWMVCANAGDSRAVYKTSSMTIPLSFDHKPDDDLEETRIRKAGGYVSGGRVDGDLAVSRGLGDFRFKTSPQLRLEDQKVSPLPELITKPRNDAKDEFLVLACDGIWDVVSNQECTRILSDIFGEGETDVGLVCEELLDTCLRLGSKDNMTALIVKLPGLTIGSGGGVEARRQRLKEPIKSQNEARNDRPELENHNDTSEVAVDNSDEKPEESLEF